MPYSKPQQEFLSFKEFVNEKFRRRYEIMKKLKKEFVAYRAQKSDSHLYTPFVSRTRIENARGLLRNPLYVEKEKKRKQENEKV